jgi:hypothetical protein
MLTGTGNPTYTNLLGILRAIGLSLAIQVEAKTSKSPSHKRDESRVAKVPGRPARNRRSSSD